MKMPDPKGIAALIIAKKGEPVKHSEEGNEHADDMLTEAGEEIMEAIKSDDAAGLAEALKNFIQLC